jgi:hypothetical protein
MCGYSDKSLGFYEFQRTQPIVNGMSQGPSVDATTKTDKGNS